MNLDDLTKHINDKNAIDKIIALRKKCFVV